MQLTGAVAVVTGGGGGIGAALVRRFALEGASGIVVGDIDLAAADALAKDLGPAVLAVEADAAIEEDTVRLLEIAEEQFGQVDLFCANAGMFTPGGAELADEGWDRIWRVNVMSHVHAARHYVPRWLSKDTATCCTPPLPPGCSPTSVLPPMRSRSTPWWRWRNGCR